MSKSFKCINWSWEFWSTSLFAGSVASSVRSKASSLSLNEIEGLKVKSEIWLLATWIRHMRHEIKSGRPSLTSLRPQISFPFRDPMLMVLGTFFLVYDEPVRASLIVLVYFISIPSFGLIYGTHLLDSFWNIHLSFSSSLILLKWL